MLKQVVRYLIGTEHYGILLPRTGEGLKCWVDADWERDLSKRRSRSGILIKFDSEPIIWISKLQPTTARSTAEAEFNALSQGIKKLKWIRQVLEEIGIPQKNLTTVLQDNLGAISWTQDVQGLRRVKHVGIKYHYVRDSIENKDAEVKFTPSNQNHSDSLTKTLIGEECYRHRTSLGVTI